MILSVKQRKLQRDKIRRVVDWIKWDYGLKTTQQMAKLVDIPTTMINNLCRTDAASFYKNGPPIYHLLAFCKFFGLRMEYFVDHDIPLEANFLRKQCVSLVDLHVQFRRTGDLSLFHMAAGIFVGQLSEVCDCYTQIRGHEAVITISSGEMENMSYVLSCDTREGFLVAHVFPGRGRSKETRLLTEKYIDANCEKIRCSNPSIIRG